MTVTVKHSKTNAISDWTQAQLDEQIALGNFAPGTTLAQIVLPSDWNNDHTLTGVGTMAEQNANSVAITGGSINGTTIGATTASTGKFTSVTTPSVTASSTDLTLSAISTGSVKFSTAGGVQAIVSDKASAVNYVELIGNSAGGGVSINAKGSDTNVVLALNSKGANPIQFYTSGLRQFQVSDTASAVNFVQVTGAATTTRPAITSQGSDASVGLTIGVKGTTSNLVFQNGNGDIFRINGALAQVNYLQANPSVSGNATTFSNAGTDTNISMAFQPKGTGAIDLAAGSSGVNISNGGTVTALTITNNGSSYTSIPSLAISAPTTAGGVQAVGSVANMNFSAGSPTVAAGGTGYTVGDVLTIVGGTPVSGAATLTVATVSAGVVTSATYTAYNTYSALPTNPVSVTGGTGSGATFNVLWKPNFLTIGTAGSGYIEQPTVTFSGGGGSGASAYATVGGTSVIKSIGSSGSVSLSFATPSSINNSNLPALRLLDVATFDSYPQVNPASAYTVIQATGNANANMRIGANGSGAVQFTTNGTSLVEQMRVSHTASAVNYVQVTGAATLNPPVISAQGSDATVSLLFQAKGGATTRFWSSATTEQFRITHTASAVNYLQATGSAAGSAPSFSVAGTDTNIDLALTPKGTGLVRFGTYTAGALLATGYINIKAADGTTYKVLVST